MHHCPVRCVSSMLGLSQDNLFLHASDSLTSNCRMSHCVSRGCFCVFHTHINWIVLIRGLVERLRSRLNRVNHVYTLTGWTRRHCSADFRLKVFHDYAGAPKRDFLRLASICKLSIILIDIKVLLQISIRRIDRVSLAITSGEAETAEFDSKLWAEVSSSSPA